MRKILLILMTFVAFDVKANDEFYIALGFGVGETDVSSDFRINNESKSNRTLGSQILIGYQFTNKLNAEVGSTFHRSYIIGLSDTIYISENTILLGYEIDITSSFQITPRLGYSFWKFESTEGWLLNASSGRKNETKGNQLIYNLTASSNRFYFSFQSVRYDFGKMNSMIVGMKFGF